MHYYCHQAFKQFPRLPPINSAPMAMLRIRILAAQVYVAESDVAVSLRVGMPEEHCIVDSHQQELNPEALPVVDPRTNGMYASANTSQEDVIYRGGS